MLTKNSNIYTYTLLALLTISTTACSEESKSTDIQKATDSYANDTKVSAQQTITEADLAGTDISIEDAQNFLKIKTAFASKDVAAIAKHVSYPFRVANDLPKIKDETEFKLRHKEVLDDEIFNLVGSAKLKDLSDMKSQGIMLHGGRVWLRGDEIISFHHKTNKLKELQKKQKQKRHPSAQNYKENMMEFETDKFIIKVDEQDNFSYQYISWSSGQDISEKPDLILTDGTYEGQGTQGGIIYTFKKGNYTYRAEKRYLGDEGLPRFVLYVEKDGKTIVEQGSKELILP